MNLFRKWRLGLVVLVVAPMGVAVRAQQPDNTPVSLTTFVQFVPNARGELDNSVKVRETITVDDTGNNYSARFKSVVTDTKGKVLYSGTGTETGTRLRVEPL
jgi:hypothetical protein